ncbi:hypothetical protein L1887_23056 [Cichorium endivia]|nr:hypothetical protein L1887_23056 [Cichorium endivia]
MNLLMVRLVVLSMILDIYDHEVTRTIVDESVTKDEKVGDEENSLLKRTGLMSTTWRVQKYCWLGCLKVKTVQGEKVEDEGVLKDQNDESNED